MTTAAILFFNSLSNSLSLKAFTSKVCEFLCMYIKLYKLLVFWNLNNRYETTVEHLVPSSTLLTILWPAAMKSLPTLSPQTLPNAPNDWKKTSKIVFYTEDPVSIENVSILMQAILLVRVPYQLYSY